MNLEDTPPGLYGRPPNFGGYFLSETSKFFARHPILCVKFGGLQFATQKNILRNSEVSHSVSAGCPPISFFLRIDLRIPSKFFVWEHRYFGTVLYRTAVSVCCPLPYVKIGLREGRGIESRRAQIFLLFWDSTGQLYMSAVLREDPKGSDCGRVAGSIPDELRFFIFLYCTGQLYLSALRARKIYIRYPPY
jgi:hypothetical protein